MRWLAVSLVALYALLVGRSGARGDAYLGPRSLPGPAPAGTTPLADLERVLPSPTLAPTAGAAARALSRPEVPEPAELPRVGGSIASDVSRSLERSPVAWPAEVAIAEELAHVDVASRPMMMLSEPASMVLVGTGILGLWARGRLRAGRRAQADP